MLFTWRITVAYLRIVAFSRQKWSLQHVPIVRHAYFSSLFLCNEYFVSRSLLFHSVFFFFFPVALLPDSGSWHPLTGLWDHTRWTHRTGCDSSGRVINPKHRPVSDNTRHSQDTNVDALAGFEPALPASERSQTQALYYTTTGIVTSILSFLFFPSFWFFSPFHFWGNQVNYTGTLYLQVLIALVWRCHSSVSPTNWQDILIKLYLQGAIVAFVSVCLCPAVSAEVLLTQFNNIITLPTLTLCIACWLAAVQLLTW